MAGSMRPQSRRLDLEQRADLGCGEGQHVGGVEEPAVEPLDALHAEHPAAARHRREQLPEGGREVGGLRAGRVGQAMQEILGQQPSVLGEQAEQELVEEVGDALGLVTARLEGHGEFGEVAGGDLGELRRAELGAQGLGIGEDSAQDPQRLGGVGPRQVVEGHRVEDRREVREVGAHLDPLEVGHDEERRVLQGVLVADELQVRCLQILALALVLPGEVAVLLLSKLNALQPPTWR